MDPDESNTREELMRLVRLVAVEGSKTVEAFAGQQKLHQTDVEALTLLVVSDAQRKQLTVGALGGELGITSGATTFVVNRLELAGLINRVRDQSDNRKFLLHLSDAGRMLAEEFFSPVLHLSNAVMDKFTLAELKTVQRFLLATAKAMAAHRNSLAKPKARA